MSFRACKHIDSRASARPATDTGPNRPSAMKRLLSIALLAIIPAIVSAQTRSRERQLTDQTASSESKAVRNRLAGPTAANNADGQKPQLLQTTDDQAAPQKDLQSSQPAWGNTSVIVRPQQTPRGVLENAAI